MLEFDLNVLKIAPKLHPNLNGSGIAYWVGF